MPLNEITLEWFRGAAHAVSLQTRGKCVVVYGPNGSGKTSFVDGIEYLISGGKIRHLAHEYSGRRLEKAILNSHSDVSLASVALKLDDTTVKAVIARDGRMKSEGNSALDGWDLRRTVLRQDELAQFVASNKAEKYSALLPLLGLSDIEVVAQNIRGVARKVRELAQLEHSQGQVHEIRSRISEAFGSTEITALRDAIQDLFASYFPSALKPTTLGGALRLLKEENERRVAELDSDSACLLQLKAACDANLSSVLSRALIANEKLAQHTEPMLTERLSILRSCLKVTDAECDVADIACPCCGTSMPRAIFRLHVSDELRRLEHVSSLIDNRRSVYKELASALTQFKNAIGHHCVTSWREHPDQSEFTREIANVFEFDQHRLLDELDPPSLAPLVNGVPTLCSRVEKEAARATPSAQLLLKEHRQIEAASRFSELRKLQERIDRVAPLLHFLNELEREVRREINSRTDSVISDLSSDIQRIWLKLHPGEPIEDIRLLLGNDDAKSVDVALKFFDKPQESPRLTLSEGHRNSLGLAVFLAFAKHGSASAPLVLDDIVTSFDREHRCFVADVILSEFQDRQIILFTHDDQWFTELRYRLPANRWLFKCLRSWQSPTIGISWDTSAQAFDAARALLAHDASAAANKARGLMDVHMAIIAELLELPVPHVRGAKNDLRNALDLLRRFQSRANDKLRRRGSGGSYLKWTAPIDAAKAAADILVPWGNSASHGRRVSVAEAEILINHCESAISALTCIECQTPIWHAVVEGKHQRCDCDGLRWHL